MLDHLDLNVSDLGRSRAFYGEFLGRIGYHEFEEGAGWCSFVDPSGAFYLVLVQAGEGHLEVGFHRKRVGVNHLAFAAPSEQAVNDLAAWLDENDVFLLYDSPLRMGDRYAVFFEDPDRLKIEFVFRPANAP